MVFGTFIIHRLLLPDSWQIKNFYREYKDMEVRGNSLQQGEKVCLFCLETIKQDEVLPNPIGCRCTLSTHQRCLQGWFEQKHNMECPICHTIGTPMPFQISDTQHIIHFIHVDVTAQQREQQRIRGREKAVAFCCCLLLGWALGLSIIEWISTT